MVDSRSGVKRAHRREALLIKAQHELVVRERQSNPDDGRVFNSSVHVIKFHRTVHPQKGACVKTGKIRTPSVG